MLKPSQSPKVTNTTVAVKTSCLIKSHTPLPEGRAVAEKWLLATDYISQPSLHRGPCD